MKRILKYERSFGGHQSKRLSLKMASKIMTDIWREHERRRKAKVSFEDGSDTRNESAKNFLRREIFALGTFILDQPPLSWRLDDLVDELRDNRTTRPEALSNVFHALLMCVYRSESESRISRQERSLMAMELEYAHRHEVPAWLLCGFLYQSTNRKKLGERLEKDFREPAYQR